MGFQPPGMMSGQRYARRAMAMGGYGGRPAYNMGMQGMQGMQPGMDDRGLTPDRDMYYERERSRIQGLIDRNPYGPNVATLYRGLDNLADRRSRNVNVDRAWNQRIRSAH